MGNHVEKLRKLTEKHKHGFAESLKNRISNTDTFDASRVGMSIHDISKAYHQLKIQHESSIYKFKE
jgi:hypothetical protein